MKRACYQAKYNPKQNKKTLTHNFLNATLL